MLEKEITTSKGTFVVNNYRKGVALIDITEESASEIVEKIKISFYNEDLTFCNNPTAINSLHSLLKSNNIEITNKLYIFKK